MVKGWLRDTARALLELGWSGTRNNIIAEFKRNPSLYPQASDTIASFGEYQAHFSMNSTFSSHSSTGKYKDKDELIVFRHLDGNPEKNSGHWELIYYDTEWDDDGYTPSDGIEFIEIDRFLCNPKTVRYLIGINDGDEPGHVYAVSNPAWGGWIKVGRAGSISSRLSSYQTGSPKRDYEEEYSKYFLECGFAEKSVHSKLRRMKIKGKKINSDHEWFETDLATVISVIESL